MRARPASRAGRRTETVPQPRPMRHRFVESIIHEAFARSHRSPADSVAARDPDRLASPPSPGPTRRAPRAFAAWLARVGAAPRASSPRALRPASSDASFRRYLRADRAGGGSVIVMDAPPPQEDVRPFVHVAGLIAGAGLHAPRVLEADAEHGFLLLDDLGSELYLAALQDAQARGDAGRADALMRDAIAALVAWQGKRAARGAAALRRRAAAPRARALSRVVRGARVRRRPGARPSAATWRRRVRPLVASALAQPKRRRAPRLDAAQPDGRRAATPASSTSRTRCAARSAYDVASLLRDAFISWDEEQEIDWAIRYWEAARKAGLPVTGDFGEFWRGARVDGPAAPPQGARHLLAPEAPRRQAGVQRRPAALLRLRAQGRDALLGAAAARPACSSR